MDLDRRPPSAMPGGIQRRILASEAWRASDLQDDQGFESSNNLLRALVCNPHEIQPEKRDRRFLKKRYRFPWIGKKCKMEPLRECFVIFPSLGRGLRDTAVSHNRKSLDAIEGEGTNYARHPITVKATTGQLLTAITYRVINPRPG